MKKMRLKPRGICFLAAIDNLGNEIETVKFLNFGKVR